MIGKLLGGWSVYKEYKAAYAILKWRSRGYTDYAPQFVKEKVLEKHGVPNATWVETGTFQGATTKFLAGVSPRVITIEPEPDLYRNAKLMFDGQNVEVINGVSEAVFPGLLSKLSGDINFWLDAHFSGGVTFKGDKICPILDELGCIDDNLTNFDRISILIDDVRGFVPAAAVHGYPSIDYLVDWTRERKFNWRVEHDIFIIRNWH